MAVLSQSQWQKIKLGDVSTISRGSSPRPIANQKYFVDGNIPWIKIADATKSGKYLYETKEHVNSYGASFSRLLPKGSLIVAASGTLGYTQFLGVDGCVHDGWLIVNPDESKLNKDFLYYKLIEQQKYFYNSAYGAAIQNVNTGILRDLEMNLPDMTTQILISETLSAYDDLIENHNHRIKILGGVIRKIYSEWFINFRFPNHQNVDLGKDGLPDGWIQIKLNECLKVSRGKSYTGVELIESETSVPLINLKCINRFGGFRKDGLKSFSGNYKDSHIVRKGDIVMAVTDMTQERMIVARSARVPSLGSEFGVISMDLIKIEPKDNCDKDFLYAYLRWSDFADNVKNYANGANVLHLLPSRVAEYEMILPPLELQQKFSVVVKDMFEQIDILELACANLKKTRDLLIPQLVTGKLEIKS